MRKLKLQMQMSLDGFASTGPNDEQKWVTWALSDIYPKALNLLDSIDTIIIGRKLAVDYIPYWQDVETQPHHEMYEFAKRIVAAKKIIFTKTITESIWPNTDLAKGDLVNEITKLKNQNGKDIIVYGGTSFVSALINEKLIDELHLFVNPVAIGKGESIFSKLAEFQNLKLKQSIVYNSGIVMLNYEPK
ncbi:MAG: deaminase [Marivirga sp.]|nr:deaminase [Marivirga sp.]